MSAIDTAKEIAKIAITSGLSREIIELLEKKIVLLTEQVAALESENANLKTKVKELEQKLADLSPLPGGLDKVSLNFLKLLFEHDELSIEAIAASLKISKGMAQYHCDLLSEAEMIQQTRIGYESDFGSSPGAYGILLKGREYVVKHS